MNLTLTPPCQGMGGGDREAIKSPNHFCRAYSKFFHENNYTPDTVVFNCRYHFFFIGSGGKREGNWLRVGNVIFVWFAWVSVYRFSFVFFLALFWNREWFNTMTGIWGLLILVQDIRRQNN